MRWGAIVRDACRGHLRIGRIAEPIDPAPERAEAPPQPPPARGWRAASRDEAAVLVVVAVALALWLVATLPAALGRTTFCYRDLAEVFIPLKSFGAAELHAG